MKMTEEQEKLNSVISKLSSIRINIELNKISFSERRHMESLQIIDNICRVCKTLIDWQENEDEDSNGKA